MSALAPLQTLRYGLDPEGFFASAHRRHGDVFEARVLSECWLVLAHPDAVRETFALGPEQVNSGEANFALRPLIGARNVLLMDGEEHLARRKLLLPALHGDRMRAYEQTIREAVAAEIHRIPLGQPVAMLPRMQELTFVVILRCVFGVGEGERLRSLGGALRQMLTWITDMRRALIFGLLSPERLMRLPGFRRQLATLDAAIATEIRLRREANDLDRREDILSLLLSARDEEGRGLTDADFRDELATLLIAGHETTATLIAWALHELARAQSHQDRLAAGEEGFLEATIAEALRLRPPAPLVLRRLRRLRSEATIAGRRLPAGTTLAPCALLVQRRSDLYPDPWSFDPTRFLAKRPPRGEWFAFGGSVRRAPVPPSPASRPGSCWRS